MSGPIAIKRNRRAKKGDDQSPEDCENNVTGCFAQFYKLKFSPAYWTKVVVPLKSLASDGANLIRRMLLFRDNLIKFNHI